MSQTTLPIRRALVSVSDKTGLLDLARALAAQGAEILSTGGLPRRCAMRASLLRKFRITQVFPKFWMAG